MLYRSIYCHCNMRFLQKQKHESMKKNSAKYKKNLLAARPFAAGQSFLRGRWPSLPVMRGVLNGRCLFGLRTRTLTPTGLRLRLRMAGLRMRSPRRCSVPSFVRRYLARHGYESPKQIPAVRPLLAHPQHVREPLELPRDRN